MEIELSVEPSWPSFDCWCWTGWCLLAELCVDELDEPSRDDRLMDDDIDEDELGDDDDELFMGADFSQILNSYDRFKSTKNLSPLEQVAQAGATGAQYPPATTLGANNGSYLFPTNGEQRFASEEQTQQGSNGPTSQGQSRSQSGGGGGNNNGASNNKRARFRSVLSDDTVRLLKAVYESNPKPSKREIIELADRVDYPPRVVQVWFQNTRARDRRLGRLPASATSGGGGACCSGAAAAATTTLPSTMTNEKQQHITASSDDPAANAAAALSLFLDSMNPIDLSTMVPQQAAAQQE